MTKLSNREKAVIVSALKDKYALPLLFLKLNLPKSSYYYQRSAMIRCDKYERLRTRIREIFHENRDCYGYRRILSKLNQQGIIVSEKVVRRLMKEDTLVVCFIKQRKLTIPHIRDLFNCRVGLSDHTLGIGVSVAGIALGAEVIERHFTLSREDGGVDAKFSLEPEEMKRLIVESRNAYKAIGGVHYGVTEQESILGRRSLYIVEDMQAGEVINERNVRRIRPGLGLSPKYYEIVLGRKVKKASQKGTALTWSLID